MSLLDQIKKDVQVFVSDPNGFGTTLNLTAPNGQIAAITGLGTKHHFEVDEMGKAVNSKNTHFGFSEQELIETNPDYPIRNAKGEVDLMKHKIAYADSTGTVKTYMIQQWHPDETIGYIRGFLQDFKNG